MTGSLWLFLFLFTFSIVTGSLCMSSLNMISSWLSCFSSSLYLFVSIHSFLLSPLSSNLLLNTNISSSLPFSFFSFPHPLHYLFISSSLFFPFSFTFHALFYNFLPFFSLLSFPNRFFSLSLPLSFLFILSLLVSCILLFLYQTSFRRARPSALLRSPLD